MTLKEIQKYYPKAKYEPRPDCSMCNGEGIVRKPKNICKLGFRSCLCVWTGNVELAKLCQDIFNKNAQDYKKENL